jgi:hypothetical protein
MAVRLMLTALPRTNLSEADAIAILEYHLRRNRVARKAHVKAWRKRHKKITYKVLL